MITFLENLINGINLGSVYAIIALGYTMVYGIARMLNFAHGDIIMVGAYISYMVMARHLPPILAVLAAMAFCLVLGVVIEEFAYRPLRQATSLSVLITAIGVSYLLQQSAQLIWKADSKVYGSVLNADPIIVKFSETSMLTIRWETLLTVAVTVIIMVALTLFTGKTKMGKAMRAVSEDKGAAELMGINVNVTIAMTFAIGSALAAVAGVLYCSSIPGMGVSPTLGSMPGIKAFTAAVFGGIGSIPGAMVGGLLLGIIEIMGKKYVTQELYDALVFAVLIIVLLFKPAGLFGHPAREKV